MLKYSYDLNGNLVSQTVATISLPVIMSQPVMCIAEPGQVATFSVVVANTSDVKFQWKFNGNDIPGAKGDSLLLTNVSTASEGQYTVVMTNSVGSVTSTPAALMLDSDRDGLPDNWEIASFGNLTNQRGAGDPDNDGVSNIDEFFDGTDPKSSTSLRPRLVAYSDPGGSLTVAPMKLSYNLGEIVTLTATPITPSVFIGWVGEDLPSISNPITFPMNSNKTVRAKFATPVPLPPGLVAWWRAENNALDVTGVNHGTLVAGTSFAAGKVGQAFVFNGRSRINVPGSETLNVGAGDDLTIEVWIRPNGLTNRYTLVHWAPGITFWINAIARGQGGAGCLMANIVDNDFNSHIIASKPDILSTRDWQHVAFTYHRPSGISSLFLNGIAVATVNLGSLIPLQETTTYTNLYLGTDEVSAYYGLMDEPTIFNRALTTNEIFDIYNADFVGKNFTHPYFTSLSPLPDSALDVNYTQQLTTILGTPPICFSLSAGALPPGMNLSTAGVISGISSEPGVFDFTVRAKDAVDNFTEQLYLLRVRKRIRPPRGLVAWWRAENNALDVTGVNHGTLGEGTSFAAGKVGQAFSGMIIVRASKKTTLNIFGKGHGLTLEAWIKPTDKHSEKQPFFAWKRENVFMEMDVGFVFINYHGKSRLYARVVDPTSTDRSIYSPSGLVSINTWQHVAFSYDCSSGISRIFLNGVIVASEDLGSSTPITTGDLYLGGLPGYGSFVGLMDEPTIYNRALSPEEVASIYDASSVGKNPNVIFVLPPPWFRRQVLFLRKLFWAFLSNKRQKSRDR